MSGDKSTKEKISIATNNADSVVVGSDAENNVVVFHSLSNLVEIFCDLMITLWEPLEWAAIQLDFQ